MSNPEDHNLFTLEAFDYYYAEQYSDAEEKFRIAIADNSNNAVAWKGYYMALVKVGKDSDARNAIQRSLDLNPKDPESWFCLATFLDERDLETSTALDAYHRGLALAPAEGEMWRNLAILYKKSGNLTKAEAVMREVLEYWPDDTLHLRVLEWVLQHQGRTYEVAEINARIRTIEADERQHKVEFDREVSDTVREIMGFDIDDDNDEEIPESEEMDYITRMYEEEFAVEEKKESPSQNVIKKVTIESPKVSDMSDDDEDIEIFEGSLFGDDDEDIEDFEGSLFGDD